MSDHSGIIFPLCVCKKGLSPHLLHTHVLQRCCVHFSPAAEPYAELQQCLPSCAYYNNGYVSTKATTVIEVTTSILKIGEDMPFVGVSAQRC